MGDVAHAQARERELLLSGGDWDDERPSLLRPDIRESWRRSQMVGLAPETDDIPFVTDLPDDSRLLRATQPVLDRLEQRLTEAPMTILLADRRAQIIDRRVSDPSARRRLDAASVAPGFAYSEEATGTNGIGTALEERRLFSVQGGEHFRESLQGLACVGKPIVHPISGAVEGILDITCKVAEANPLMTPLVEAAVQEIEQRLYELASRDERVILESFLRSSRRGSRAMISMNSDLVMATPAASRLLQPADRTHIWNWACLRLGAQDEFLGQLRLSDHTEIMAKARRIEDGTRQVGVSVELRLPSRRQDRATTESTRPVRVASMTTPSRRRAQRAAKTLPREVRHLADDPGPVLVTGGRGVGKAHSARALVRHWAPDVVVLEQDLVIDLPDDARAWVTDLRQHLDGGGAAVLRHLDVLDEARVAPFASLLEVADREGWLLLLTGPERADGPVARAYAHVSRRAALKPLASRPDELEGIVRAVLRRADGRPGQRVHPAALQALMAQPWPGNVRELRSVVQSAGQLALGGDIGVQHLPAGYGETKRSRSMSPIERSEREIFIEALRQTAGNKSEAAELLGVARSTLYRKLRSYGIDGERFVDPR